MFNIFTLLGFFLLNGALAVSSFIFVLAMERYRLMDRSRFFLATFIMYVTQIVLIEIVLGIFDSISYPHVAMMGLGLFVVAMLLFYKNRKNISIIKKTIRSPFHGVWLIFLPLIALLMVRAFNALLQIPLEYDSVAYHLPFITEWLHTGSLRELYYSAFAGPIAYYPSTYELLDLWTLLPFRNDFFLNLINFPLLAIFGFTFYKLLRNVKITQAVAALTVALLLFMPVFLRQAGLPLVDLFFCLTFVIALYFLQCIWMEEKQNSYGSYWFFGLSLGLFMGTKYLGIVMAPPLLFVLLLLLFKKRQSWRHAAKNALIAAVGIFATGSFFYLRNWVNASNPLFPLEVNLGSWQIFSGYPGMKEKLIETSLVVNVTSLEKVQEFFYKFYLMVGWQGLTMGLMFFSTLGFALYQCLQLRKNKKNTVNDLIVSLLLLGTALIYAYLYVKSPYSYRDLIPNVRYAMPLLIVAAINMGFIVSRLRKLQPLFYLGSVAAITHALIFLILYPSKLLLSNDRLLLDFDILRNYILLFLLFCIGVLALLYLFHLASTRKGNWRIYSTVCCVIILISFIKVGSVTFIEREKLISYFYEKWYNTDLHTRDIMAGSLWLNENASKANIAYSGFNFHYHLYGRDLARDVDYININDCLNCRYVDYKNSPDSIRVNPNPKAWLRNLAEQQKDFLVIQPELMKDVRSFEFEWIAQYPEYFEEVFRQNDLHIYKILYE